MSQAGTINAVTDNPTVATDFVTDSGTAIPIANTIEILGDSTQGITSSGSGNTVTVTASDATTSQKGVVATSTDALTIAGSSSSTAVVPSSLAAKLGDQTSKGVPYGTGTAAAVAWTDALEDGEIVIGSTAGVPVAATLTAGSNVSIVNAGNSITISSSGGGGGLTWSTITGASQALAVDNGYVGNRATTITYTLPVTASVGAQIEILNIGVGLPVIAQNASQSINFTASTTTVGVGGSLTSTKQFGSIVLRCSVANTTWNVLGATGSWTIV